MEPSICRNRGGRRPWRSVPRSLLVPAYHPPSCQLDGKPAPPASAGDEKDTRRPESIRRPFSEAQSSSSKSSLVPLKQIHCVPIVTSKGTTLMVTAAKPAMAPLRVLLVGKKEEDFFLIREILDRMRCMLSAELEHAHSLEEAKAMLQQRAYGLVLFEYETGDARAVHLLADFLHTGVSIPYIVLTEHADENTVAEILEGGTWNC